MIALNDNFYSTVSKQERGQKAKKHIKHWGKKQTNNASVLAVVKGTQSTYEKLLT